MLGSIELPRRKPNWVRLDACLLDQLGCRKVSARCRALLSPARRWVSETSLRRALVAPRNGAVLTAGGRIRHWEDVPQHRRHGRELHSDGDRVAWGERRAVVFALVAGNVRCLADNRPDDLVSELVVHVRVGAAEEAALDGDRGQSRQDLARGPSPGDGASREAQGEAGTTVGDRGYLKRPDDDRAEKLHRRAPEERSITERDRELLVEIGDDRVARHVGVVVREDGLLVGPERMGIDRPEIR